MEFKFEIEFKQDLIEDLIVTSFEGGSWFWIKVIFSPKIKEEWDSVNYASQIINNNWTLDIYDIENDEKLGIFNNESIKKGISLLSKYPHTLANIINEDYDAIDADVFMQLCVMGEVIYG